LSQSGRVLSSYPDPDAVYIGGDPTNGASYTCHSAVRYDGPLAPGLAGTTTKNHASGPPGA
jgi:hypothetical protein